MVQKILNCHIKIEDTDLLNQFLLFPKLQGFRVIEKIYCEGKKVGRQIHGYHW